jgi:hypothetical protein
MDDMMIAKDDHFFQISSLILIPIRVRRMPKASIGPRTMLLASFLRARHVFEILLLPPLLLRGELPEDSA